MTRKERILRMVQRQPDDVAYTDVIRRIIDMHEIELGLAEIDRGEVIDHEELVQQLEMEWRELESSGPSKPKKAAAKSATGSPKTPPARPRRSKSA